jgi:hypothetical protein
MTPRRRADEVRRQSKRGRPSVEATRRQQSTEGQQSDRAQPSAGSDGSGTRNGRFGGHVGIVVMSKFAGHAPCIRSPLVISVDVSSIRENSRHRQCRFVHVPPSTGPPTVTTPSHELRIIHQSESNTVSFSGPLAIIPLHSEGHFRPSSGKMTAVFVHLRYCFLAHCPYRRVQDRQAR